MTVIRGIDAMIRTLYGSFEEMKDATGRPLSAADAALQLALARHPAMVGANAVIHRLDAERAALSRSGEVDRTPKPAVETDGSPDELPAIRAYFTVAKLTTDAKDELLFSLTNGSRALSYSAAVSAANREADSVDGVARPVVVLAVTDVFMPPERPASTRYRIRRK